MKGCEIEAAVREAMMSKKAFIVANATTITTKRLREEIGQELGLSVESMAGVKSLVKSLALEFLAPAQAEEAGSKAAPRTKKAAQNVSSEITALKRVLKLATIRIPPRVFVINKNKEESLRVALESLLEKHGLSVSSSRKRINKVKKRLEVERDMEGIDVSNVIAGRRRQ